MAEGVDPDILAADRAGFFYTDDDGVGFLTEEERRDYELAKQLEEEEQRLDREREEQAQMDRAIAESLRTGDEELLQTDAAGMDFQQELREQLQLEEVIKRSMADPDSPLSNLGVDMPSLPDGVDLSSAQAIMSALGVSSQLLNNNNTVGSDSADGVNNNEDLAVLGSVQRELKLQEEVRLRSQGSQWGQGSGAEAESDAERERRIQMEWEREEAEEDMMLAQVLSQQRPQVTNNGPAAGRSLTRCRRSVDVDNREAEEDGVAQGATASSAGQQFVPHTRRRSVEIVDDVAEELKFAFDGPEPPTSHHEAQGSRENFAAWNSRNQRRSVDMEEDVEEGIAMGAASNTRRNTSSQPQSGAGATPAGAMKPYPVDPDYDEEFPCNWTLGLDRDQQCHHIRLLTTSEEYRRIAEEFSRVNITVECIERVQNVYLWGRLQDEKGRMQDIYRSESFDVNERYLFHGTQSSAVNEICDGLLGLDQRLARIGHFGRGIYFSDDPRKCVDYSASTTNQDSFPCILKCRVLLGDAKVYPHGQTNKDLRREPPREHQEPGMLGSYDSVQGCVKEYNEFVIYSNFRTLPEYIIHYRVPGRASSTAGESSQAQNGTTASTVSATPSKSPPVSVITDSHPETEEDESKEMDTSLTATETSDEHPEVERSDTNNTTVAMATGSEGLPGASGGMEEEEEDLDPHEQRIRRVRAIVQAERKAEAEARQRQREAEAERRRKAASQAEQQGQGAQLVSSEPSTEEGRDEHEAKLRRVRKIVQDRRRLEKLMRKAGRESDLEELMKVYDEQYGSATQGASSDSDDPVTLVMEYLVPDFLEITGLGTDDVGTAKDFLQAANMDLQKAINLYYSSL